MKLLSLFILLLLTTVINNSFAQDSFSIEFENKSDTISEVYGESGYTLQTLNVIITKTVELTEKYQFNIALENVSPVSNDVELLTRRIIIEESNFGTENKLTIPIYFKVAKDKTDETDEVFKIILSAEKTDQKSFLGEKKETIVTLKNAEEVKDYLKESLFDPLRVTVGANFDFKEKISSTFYFDATVYKPNLFSWKTDMNKWKNFYSGFYASVYHNNYSSIDSIIDKRNYNSLVGAASKDSSTILSEQYKVVSNTQISNTAIEGGFTIGYFEELNPGETISLTLITPELSARRRIFSTTNSYSILSQDTLFPVPYNDTLNFLTKNDFRNRVDQETSIGFGFILDYKNIKYGQFMAKLSGGMSFLNSTKINGLYFSGRLQFVDPKVGINLGVEVRGFSGQARDRYMGVYLSKSFSLKKLTTF